MASNSRDRNGGQFVRDRDCWTDDEFNVIQRYIEEEVSKEANNVTHAESIYWVVLERFNDVKERLRLDGFRNRILEMIKTALARLHVVKASPAIESNGYEPVKVKKSGKSLKNKEDISKTNQMDTYVSDNLLALQEERELNEVLIQSKIHMEDQIEFENELKEAMAKSYIEEKSKLLTMLRAGDCDFRLLANQMNKVLPDETTVPYKGESFTDRSALILAIIQLFDHDYTIINAPRIQKHIKKFVRNCWAAGSNAIYQKDIHRKNASSTFNVPSINDYLVNIDIKGDGNCMWSSVSHSLVGDYSLMESLRLLTTYALMHFSNEFSEILTKQVSKFSYNPLTLEQLTRTSVTLQSWGDEYHLMALSLALKRPIYSYGSLTDNQESAVLGYEQFRKSYETESFPNHFRYIGDGNDADKEPILLHYDGSSHYSCVLKTFESARPLVPFIQIIGALFNVNDDTTQPGVPHGLVGNMADQLTSQHNATHSDESEKLKMELLEKDILLRQYERFYEEIKKMLDSERIDLRQLKQLVEIMENNRK